MCSDGQTDHWMGVICSGNSTPRASARVRNAIDVVIIESCPTNSWRPATVIRNAETQFALCTRFACKLLKLVVSR